MIVLLLYRRGYVWGNAQRGTVFSTLSACVAVPSTGGTAFVLLQCAFLLLRARGWALRAQEIMCQCFERLSPASATPSRRCTGWDLLPMCYAPHTGVSDGYLLAPRIGRRGSPRLHFHWRWWRTERSLMLGAELALLPDAAAVAVVVSGRSFLPCPLLGRCRPPTVVVAASLFAVFYFSPPAGAWGDNLRFAIPSECLPEELVAGVR